MYCNARATRALGTLERRFGSFENRLLALDWVNSNLPTDHGTGPEHQADDLAESYQGWLGDMRKIHSGQAPTPATNQANSKRFIVNRKPTLELLDDDPGRPLPAPPPRAVANARLELLADS